MVDTALDIDIWGYGRDAGQAGLFSLKMMKAAYPYVGPIDDAGLWIRLSMSLHEHFERNLNDQHVWKLMERHIFFTNREDADFCRALQYVV